MAIVKNSIKFSTGGGSEITVVANYSALPDPTTVSGEFYWCSASQGTSWLPGSLGGTYYNSGLYYSNGTTWEFLNVPFNATQAEVNTGTNNDKFVTPKTFTDASKWGTKQDTLTFDSTPTDGSSNPVESGGVYNALPLISSTTTAGANTSGTSNTYSQGVQVLSSKITEGDQIVIYVRFKKTGTAGVVTLRHYANATNDLSGTPVLLGTSQQVASTRISSVYRVLDILKKDGTGSGTYGSNATASIVNDLGALNAVGANHAIDWGTNPYIVTALECASGSDVANVTSIKITK